MSDLRIKGLNIEEYAKFSSEAQELARRWEASGKELDIRAEMEEIYSRYRQDFTKHIDTEGDFDYSACGIIPEWQDILNGNPELALQYNKIRDDFLKPDNEVGTPRVAADLSFEGISIAQFAEANAKLQGVEPSQQAAVLEIVGVSDLDAWTRASAAFEQAMQNDTSGKIANYYGKLYASFGGQEPAQTRDSQQAEFRDEILDDKEIHEQVVRTIMKMALEERKPEIIPYLKKSFPQNTRQYKNLHWLEPFIKEAAKLLAEADKKKSARLLFDLQFELTDNQGIAKNEWIDKQLNNIED